MSTSIGIGINENKTRLPYENIRQLVEAHGYGLVTTPQNAEADMRSGLLQVSKKLNWDAVLLFKTPIDGNCPLAFGIQEELSKFESENVYPKFFECLTKLHPVLKGVSSEFWMFFASEWKAGDRPRYEEGSFEVLISFLQRPANWYQRIFVPETGIVQYSGESPLIFRVTARRQP